MRSGVVLGENDHLPQEKKTWVPQYNLFDFGYIFSSWFLSSQWVRIESTYNQLSIAPLQEHSCHFSSRQRTFVEKEKRWFELHKEPVCQTIGGEPLYRALAMLETAITPPRYTWRWRRFLEEQRIRPFGATTNTTTRSTKNAFISEQTGTDYPSNQLDTVTKITQNKKNLKR